MFILSLPTRGRETRRTTNVRHYVMYLVFITGRACFYIIFVLASTYISALFPDSDRYCIDIRIVSSSIFLLGIKTLMALSICENSWNARLLGYRTADLSPGCAERRALSCKRRVKLDLLCYAHAVL